MAKTKISELQETTSLDGGTDVLMLVQDGANKKITVNNLLNSINTNFTMVQGSNKFDVKYNNNSNSLLVVDQSSSKVGIGVNVPEELLHVNGNLKIGGKYGSGGSTIGGHLIMSSETLTIGPSQGTTTGNPYLLTNNYMVTRLTIDAPRNSVNAYVKLPTPSNTMFKIITIASMQTTPVISCSLFAESGIIVGATNILLKQTGSSIILSGAEGIWTVLGYGAGVSL